MKGESMLTRREFCLTCGAMLGAGAATAIAGPMVAGSMASPAAARRSLTPPLRTFLKLDLAIGSTHTLARVRPLLQNLACRGAAAEPAAAPVLLLTHSGDVRESLRTEIVNEAERCGWACWSPPLRLRQHKMESARAAAARPLVIVRDSTLPAGVVALTTRGVPRAADVAGLAFAESAVLLDHARSQWFSFGPTETRDAVAQSGRPSPTLADKAARLAVARQIDASLIPAIAFHRYNAARETAS